MARKKRSDSYPLRGLDAADLAVISRRLAELHAASGKSYADVAKELGIYKNKHSGEDVKEWYQHPDKIPKRYLEPLCEALGVSRDYILGGLVFQPGLEAITSPTRAVHGIYTDENLTMAYGMLTEKERKAFSTLLGSLTFARSQDIKHSSEVDYLASLAAIAAKFITAMAFMIGEEEVREEFGPSYDDLLRRLEDASQEYGDGEQVEPMTDAEIADFLESINSDESLRTIREQTNDILDGAQKSGKKAARE